MVLLQDLPFYLVLRLVKLTLFTSLHLTACFWVDPLG